eukprot:CAMPEP_0114284960 /NCGR_PEP_ID=MMETSP0059-20121206/4925_1 /TAXON_ID=36894 /ORGANISM="Pyramimonas parkeae, Strain CCMP726" /LENGTH=134 /DNA_ID=CAMNT_0001405813 /DNA_START=103 /DNA_END=507 /DNA_ORIENTATION=+
MAALQASLGLKPVHCAASTRESRTCAVLGTPHTRSSIRSNAHHCTSFAGNTHMLQSKCATRSSGRCKAMRVVALLGEVEQPPVLADVPLLPFISEKVRSTSWPSRQSCCECDNPIGPTIHAQDESDPAHDAIKG